MADCVPGFAPTLMQHTLAGGPHHNPDSTQTGDSSAARLAAVSSAGGGSSRAARSAATSAAARTPPGPAAWSRGLNQSLSASGLLPPEPAAPHSFPFIHAASTPTNLSLFTSAALGTPPPAARSQAPPSLLGYPPLLGTETPLDASLGTGDCFPGAAAPSSYSWSADGLFFAPGIEYLPGTAALVPYPARASSPVDCAAFR